MKNGTRCEICGQPGWLRNLDSSIAPPIQVCFSCQADYWDALSTALHASKKRIGNAFRAAWLMKKATLKSTRMAKRGASTGKKKKVVK